MERSTVLASVPNDSGCLPTGTVTFLFTDIEGSTLRWERDREAMQDALLRHDVLMREAIAAQNGCVFKTIGDAFCAVFWNAKDAIAAALAAQRSLSAEDFTAVEGMRVRMAIHAGTTDERDSDYFGPTVNRVARLLAIAHGGQVLLSASAVELAGVDLPPSTSLRDMGDHRLKDLTTPEHVFQLASPDLASDFPRLRSLNIIDNNLPQQLTTFVGRAQDVAQIKALLARSRLVTLFGAGGVGKTRCAVQVGADLLEERGDGVWFADLAALRDPALVPNEIASIFTLQESSNRPMLDTVIAHLRNKHLLLILDNCEHLIVEAARTTAAILRDCQHVRILATSREALNIAGEMVHLMPSLEVPKVTKELTAESALAYDAIALFEARARATQHSFTLTAENAPSVAEICRRLDGIPLAIELAAARVRVLGPRQLAQKLDERFRILTGGDRTVLPRQKTMRALIDWSYDLLSPSECRLFRCLSIFGGNFSLESAVAVCANDAIPEFEVLDLLTSLVEKSLVLAEPVGHDIRYRLLESMRQYAHEKLKEHGEYEAVAAAHAAAFADLAQQLQRDYDSVPYRVWLARAELELENVRAALTWAFGVGGDVITGQRLAATLRRVLIAFAAPEARRWVKVALDRVDASTPTSVMAELELAEAHSASVLNEYRTSLAAAQRALVHFSELNDARGIANARRWAGRAHVYLGEIAEGEALLNESLESHRALGFRQVGGTLRDLAVARGAEGDVVGARALFSRALATFAESADEGNVAITAGTLAEAEFRCGDTEAALHSALESLAAASALNRQRLKAGILNNIAAYLIVMRRYDFAREHAREALAIACDVESEILVAYALQHLGAVAALRASHPSDGASAGEDASRAARLIGFVDGRFAKLEVVREFTEQQEYDVMRAVLFDALGADSVARLAAEGGQWTQNRAIEEAEPV